MTTKYKRIIFLQGDAAIEPLKILCDQGKEAVLTYLQQWDNGEKSEMFTVSAKGTSDRIHQIDEYIINYNYGLNYIGLEEIIKDDILPYQILDVDNYFEQAEACYTVCVLNHEGQNSKKYELQCRIDFKPGHSWSESDVENENEHYAEFEAMDDSQLERFVEELEHYFENRED